MTVENAIRLLAGTLVLIGLGLGLTLNPWYFIIVAFVGVNLAQSSVTGFCPAEMILRKCGVGGSCSTSTERSAKTA